MFVNFSYKRNDIYIFKFIIYIYLNLLEIIENLFSFYQIFHAIINRNAINRFDKEINKILILSYYTFYVTDNLY